MGISGIEEQTIAVENTNHQQAFPSASAAYLKAEHLQRPGAVTSSQVREVYGYPRQEGNRFFMTNLLFREVSGVGMRLEASPSLPPSGLFLGRARAGRLR